MSKEKKNFYSNGGAELERLRSAWGGGLAPRAPRRGTGGGPPVSTGWSGSEAESLPLTKLYKKVNE